MPQVKPELETFARIKVVGVGGSGCHALSRMVSAKIEGVDFVAVNTDVQDLHTSNAPVKIHIGKNLTRGLGAGMNPEIGRQAAEENRDEIQEALKGADMVFVAGGLGGGTCTGAAPIIAEAARNTGALTVGVVTRPFAFEGQQRAQIAEDGLALLREQVDSLITIPNDRLLYIIDRKTSLLDAFAVVDDVLRQAVQGISDSVVKPGLVNVDFADIKTIMQDAGPALMGIGTSSGEERAMDAARIAINSPLLDISINGARGVLFTVTGGEDLAMSEINDAAKVVTDSINPEAKVIFGAVFDEKMKKGDIKVTVIATGFNENELVRKEDLVDRMSENDDKDEQASVRQNRKKQARKESLPRPVMHAASKGNNTESNGNGNGFANGNGANSNNNGNGDNVDWDIPAFIRNKLK